MRGKIAATSKGGCALLTSNSPYLEEHHTTYFWEVFICIERGLYSVHLSLFEGFMFFKKVFYFYQPAWRRKGTHFPIFTSAHHTQKLYVETSLFGCCINTIFHMNKVVFMILWTTIRLFLWGVPSIFPASYLFWKISQPDNNWWGTPFLRHSSRGALLFRGCVKLMISYRSFDVISFRLDTGGN